MRLLLGVALGSALGSVLRYGAERIHARIHARTPQRLLHPDLPWATLVVNVVGSALLGAVLAMHAAGHLGEITTAALGAGVAGGLTTFSTFAFDVFRLVRNGQWRLATAYAGANLVLGTAAAAVGFRLAGG